MSTLNVSNITDGTTTVGTSYVVNGSAKALFLYDQTTNTVNDSENVSSITDNSTGSFSVSFSNSFSSANIFAGTSTGNGIALADGARVCSVNYRTASSIDCGVRSTASTIQDTEGNSGALLGDLA